jgi:hypothetical protein
MGEGLKANKRNSWVKMRKRVRGKRDRIYKYNCWAAEERKVEWDSLGIPGNCIKLSSEKQPFQ